MFDIFKSKKDTDSDIIDDMSYIAESIIRRNFGTAEAMKKAKPVN